MTAESDSVRKNSAGPTVGSSAVAGDCPTDDVLRRLALGQLDAPELSSVELHTSRCSTCTQRVEQLREQDQAALESTQHHEVVANKSSVTPKPGEWPTRFRELVSDLQAGTSRQRTEVQDSKGSSPFDPAALKTAERDQRGGKLKLGTRLGVYEIVRFLGAGGIGEVYLARQTRLDRPVALKILSAKLTGDEDAFHRFDREMRAIARLDHPNVVRAYDADESEGIHFLVMEYVDGKDLHAVVRQQGPLPPDQAANYIMQAARGLAAAHAQNIVHRDIKPSNLLLDWNGQIKVLDLGLARLDGGTTTVPSAELTTSGVIMGTVDYMAPEQANDSRRVDARADIYSLGCTLFFLLTGRSPYSGGGLLDRMVAHRLNEIPNIQTFCPSVSDSLANVVARCLAKNPEDRFSSMTDLLAALADCPQSEPSNRPTNERTEQILRYEGQEATFSGPTVRVSPKFSPESTPTPAGTLPSGNRLARNVISTAAVALIALLAMLVFRDRTQREPIRSPVTGSSDLAASKAAQPPAAAEPDPPVAKAQIVDGDWGVAKVEHPETLEFLSTTASVTPQGMRYLTKFPKLKVIEWNGPATDNGLAALAELTDLQIVTIAGGPEFHGTGLKYLNKSRHLTFLKLAGSGLDDDGLMSLPDLPMLSKLGINHTKIGDRGLAALERFPELDQIAVHYCPAITDAGLIHFAALPKLDGLNLEGCPRVTDLGIEHLGRIHSMKWVNLHATGVTEAGAQRLRELLPNCKVIIEPEGK